MTWKKFHGPKAGPWTDGVINKLYYASADSEQILPDVFCSPDHNLSWGQRSTNDSKPVPAVARLEDHHCPGESLGSLHTANQFLLSMCFYFLHFLPAQSNLFFPS